MGTNATVLVRRISASRLAAWLPWIVCGLGAFFYFYELCIRVALGTMVPEVRTALNISMGQIGILSAFYYYAYTPVQIVAGALIDRLGPRKLLIGMILMCALGSFLFARSSYFVISIIAQFCLGFASAFAFVGVLKLASNWLPKKYFGLIAGLTTSLGMIGAMGSNIFIAYLLHGMGWRGVWVVFGIFGVGLMAATYLLCVNKPINDQRIFNTRLKWQEIRKDFFVMARSPFFWVNATIGGLLYYPTTSFASLWGIPFMMHVYHVNKLVASTVVSMIFLGWAIGGPLVGWLSIKHISKKVLLILGSLVSLLLITFALLPLDFTPAEYGFLLFLFGVASSVEILVFDVAAKLFDGRSAGTAVSLTNFIIMSVCALLQPVIGFLIDTHSSASQFRFALILIPVGLFIVFLLAAFAYREKYCKEGRLVVT